MKIQVSTSESLFVLFPHTHRQHCLSWTSTISQTLTAKQLLHDQNSCVNPLSLLYLNRWDPCTPLKRRWKRKPASISVVNSAVVFPEPTKWTINMNHVMINMLHWCFQAAVSQLKRRLKDTSAWLQLFPMAISLVFLPQCRDTKIWDEWNGEMMFVCVWDGGFLTQCK